MDLKWDEWRTRYAEMSVKDHQDFYDLVYAEYPSQRHYDLGALLDHVDAYDIKTVVEIGGWNGELGACALFLRPSLESWTNYEICPAAGLNSVSRDKRYKTVIPDKWFWEMDELPKADAFVASHTIEHLSEEHFDALIARLEYPSLYLDAPLPVTERQIVSWKGHTSTHILPLAWENVIARLERAGYTLAHRHWRFSVHTFRKT